MRFLVHRGDFRQLAIVAVYLSLLAAMYLIPAYRTVPVLVLACAFSFFVMTVNHNVMHQGIFTNKFAQRVFRIVLSFCALFPVSAVIPSHNLVHHHFDDDGQPDWADPHHVRFRFNLFNLIHFPNVVGPITFNGVKRWSKVQGRGQFRAQYTIESVVAFGGTGLLLLNDFWTTLFFILIPQLWGARWFLRVNLIQHDGADTKSEWNHSRNFTGRFLNWLSVNAGFHTIHHNRAGLHYSQLREAHDREVAPRIHPSLVEKSLLWYVARTYFLRVTRPGAIDVSAAERQAAAIDLASRADRRAEAELAAS